VIAAGVSTSLNSSSANEPSDEVARAARVPPACFGSTVTAPAVRLIEVPEAGVVEPGVREKTTPVAFRAVAVALMTVPAGTGTLVRAGLTVTPVTATDAPRWRCRGSCPVAMARETAALPAVRWSARTAALGGEGVGDGSRRGAAGATVRGFTSGPLVLRRVAATMPGKVADPEPRDKARGDIAVMDGDRSTANSEVMRRAPGPPRRPDDRARRGACSCCNGRRGTGPPPAWSPSAA
jgi:hypothetical protein